MRNREYICSQNKLNKEEKQFGLKYVSPKCVS